MATKDITDLQVCMAYAGLARQIDTTDRPLNYVDDRLMDATGQPRKVCERAMERANRRDLVDYGMWLRGGWLTDKGRALVGLPPRPPIDLSPREISPPPPTLSS